ncbi:M4 family metallopeptidase [Streptomyces sp. NPDC004609]|uniref:M4 family metallopeptidase n=1 Tax=Streptomyces sp. NPDC004609 TaxID=3364704 RepID=UPI0036BD1A2E
MRSTPRRRTTTTGALIATAALLAAGFQSGTSAAATTGTAAPVVKAGKADPGALPLSLTPSQRAELIRKQSATTAATATELGLSPQEKLLVRDVAQDRDGTTHTRYERTYSGLPVLGGDLLVSETRTGTTESVTKASKTKLAGTDTTAALPPATAEQQALGLARADGTTAADAQRAPRKVVWLAQGTTPVLAYETVIGGLQKDGTPNELHVVTDARSGKKLFEWQGVHTGTGNTQYSGQVNVNSTRTTNAYQLTDTARGGHQTTNLNRGTTGAGTLFTGPDDTWGNGNPADPETAAADAAYGAGLTWDYFKNVHGRTGIRGDGAGASSRVHYGTNYVNAFWQDSCFCMTYGDGAANLKPLTAIDVAAHEMTHGVTSATARLVYSGESGGLNEATSDIFAAAVEFHGNNTQDVGDYLVGEKIDIRGNGSPLRHMDTPSKDGLSKDYWYSGIGGVDVHYSSGPANHWFYLLSEGSGAKTINGVNYNSATSDGLPVAGIGRDKAALIWYKALTTKFNSTTNYAAARAGTLAVAAELYGPNSLEAKSVTDAWAGVNVGPRTTDPNRPSFESAAVISIPDNGPPVNSSVVVSGVPGNAPAALQVDVDIIHPWRGDLVVDLLAPDGTVYPLKPFSGSDSADNVQETYYVNASSETANGAWRLRVQDLAAQDEGQINKVRLTF